MNIMHLWDKRVLLDKIKSDSLSKVQVYFAVFFSPLLAIFMSGLFMLLLYFYKFVEIFFEDLIDTASEPLLNHCYTFFIIASALTSTITIIGFLWCYVINRKGDAKHFFMRMSCLNTWISIHMLICLFAFCAILGFFGLFVLYKKVIIFHAQLQKKGVVSAIVPFFVKSILAPLVGLQVAKMPPLVVKFFHTTREALFLAYFCIGALPPILSFVYYYSLARMFKIISKHP